MYIGIGLTCWETANLSPYLITLACCIIYGLLCRIEILVELHVFDPATYRIYVHASKSPPPLGANWNTLICSIPNNISM